MEMLKSTMNNIAEENNNLKLRLDLLESNHESLQDEFSKLKNEYMLLEQKNNNLKELNNKLMDRIKEQKQTIIFQENNITKLEDKITNLENTVFEQNETIKELKDENKELREEVKELKIRINEQAETIKEQQIRLDEQDETIKEQNNTIKCLTKKITILETKELYRKYLQAIQDLNDYNQLEKNNNEPMQIKLLRKLRNERVDVSHYIYKPKGENDYYDDEDTISAKLKILKTQLENIPTEVDERLKKYKPLIPYLIESLKSYESCDISDELYDEVMDWWIY